MIKECNCKTALFYTSAYYYVIEPSDHGYIISVKTAAICKMCDRPRRIMDTFSSGRRVIDTSLAEKVILDGVEHIYLPISGTEGYCRKEYVITLCGKVAAKDDTSELVEECKHCRTALTVIFVNKMVAKA